VRFSAPVQTGPGAHPASYTIGTGSFAGVKRPGGGVNHPAPTSAEVKERVELYLYSLSGSSWPVLWWTLPLPLPLPLQYVVTFGAITAMDTKNTVFWEEVIAYGLTNWYIYIRGSVLAGIRDIDFSEKSGPTLGPTQPPT